MDAENPEIPAPPGSSSPGDTPAEVHPNEGVAGIPEESAGTVEGAEDSAAEPVQESLPFPEVAPVFPHAEPPPGPEAPVPFEPRRVLVRLILLVSLGVVAVTGLVMLALWRPPESEPERDIRRAIEAIVESDTAFTAVLGEPIPAPAGPDTAWTLIRHLYRRRHHNPIWWSQAQPVPAARRFAFVVSGITIEGLDPAVYEVQGLEGLSKPDAFTAAAARDSYTRARREALTPDGIARLDLRMSLAFVRMGFHLIDGRVPAMQLDPAWRARQRLPDLARILVQSVRDDRVADALHRLTPPNADYLRLRDALERYRRLADLGEWPALGDDELKRGSHGAAVERLRARLLREGDIDSAGGEGASFDRSLEKAVRRFQARTGLPPTGVVDKRTRAALLVPVARRLEQIELNLERWRWMRAPLEPRSVRVNIPDFTVALWDSGRVRTVMPVVIGQKRSPTPIFSDSITYIEVNPTWRMPKNVIEAEILPALKKDPDYPAKHKMRLFYTHAKVMPETSWKAPDWTQLWQAEFPFMAIQDPGDDNPLGHIKFMCPNEYDVYLHDSNAPGLFGAPRRAYSHGCVRVGRPMEFAAYVLGDTSSQLTMIWDSLLVTGEHRLVRFKPPVPVHVMYWTAWADTTGTVQFRDDLYGYDAALADYLGRRVPRWRLNPDSLRTDWRARQRRGEIEP